jgi:tRNA-uridine 2-sulfurtransferase
MPPVSPERTLVALSGGVDSSVAAALLADAGDEQLVGVTLRLWSCEEAPAEGQRSCCGIDGTSAARAAAGALDIPHYVVDCREVFDERVLRPAWEEYARGRTPSPCVLCNAEVKFGHLLGLARRRFGATRVATGHHARITRSQEGPALLRGADPVKDQSYFLFALSTEQLDAACFPVGRMTKQQVREEARRRGLPNAERVESQDACLVSADGAGFGETLRRRFEGPLRPGAIVSPDGARLGDHQGVHNFTIGQRKGLGVALGRPAFVRSLDAARAEVVLTDRPEDLLAAGFSATDASWLLPPERAPGWDGEGFEAEVQIRYRHAPVAARIAVQGADGRRVVVRFATAQRAVTPGQAAVFYSGERVLGGAWIERTIDERS